MPSLIWTPAALKDMKPLYRAWARHSKTAAKNAVAAIRAHLKLIAAEPQAGRRVRDWGSEYRLWPVPFSEGSCFVLYRYEGGTAVILAVRPGPDPGLS